MARCAPKNPPTAPAPTIITCFILDSICFPAHGLGYYSMPIGVTTVAFHQGQEWS